MTVSMKFVYNIGFTEEQAFGNKEDQSAEVRYENDQNHQ